MTIAGPDFLAAFPEFANATVYPETQIDFWIGEGYAQLNACLFGTQIDMAVMLFTAHNVVLSAREARQTAAGQIAGEVRGPMSSKSVGPLSVGYAGATNIPGAGAYNYTTYGQRLFLMMRAYAAGPKYVARTCAPPLRPWMF